ncbi:MAG TPA: DUF72 domain-containing protein [Pseudonocardiaceae bacterium]
MTIRIGTSGWNCPEWSGFYHPPEPAHRRELEHLAGRMPTVELNGSFYQWRRPAGYRAWCERTPESVRQFRLG